MVVEEDELRRPEEAHSPSTEKDRDKIQARPAGAGTLGLPSIF